jgi:hypothetical protein
MGHHTTARIHAGLWDHKQMGSLICPKCGGELIVVQLDPIEDWQNPYNSYNSVIECINCSFHTKATSFTILGSVNDFTVDTVKISGWSPSGSRIVADYEHILNYELLKEIKTNNELVEFLIVDNHVIQVID